MRTALKAAAALAVPVLALPACGGSGHGTAPGTAAPSVTATVPVAAWPSARAIAVQVGATGIEPATPGLFASDEVTAIWHGRDVSIVTFASVQLRENWVKVASQFTPILTEGPQFAISDNGPAS